VVCCDLSLSLFCSSINSSRTIVGFFFECFGRFFRCHSSLSLSLFVHDTVCLNCPAPKCCIRPASLAHSDLFDPFHLWTHRLCSVGCSSSSSNHHHLPLLSRSLSLFSLNSFASFCCVYFLFYDFHLSSS
jgi:hypothetical protein